MNGSECEQLPPQILLLDAQPWTQRTCQAGAVVETPSLASFVSASAVLGPWLRLRARTVTGAWTPAVNVTLRQIEPALAGRYIVGVALFHLMLLT